MTGEYTLCSTRGSFKDMDLVIVKRILSRVRFDESGCWLWTGGLMSAGHGQIWYQGKPWGTHVLMYLNCVGELPDGLYVLHTCDTPNCCNPGHLEAGPRSKNAKDAIDRGLRKTKLSVELAEEIRSKYDGKWGSQTRLAKEYGVNSRTICSIIHGDTWIRE